MTDVTVTADQLEEAILNALHAHDVQAVDPLLRSLALLDPYRAETVLKRLQLAVEIAKAGVPSTGDSA